MKRREFLAGSAGLVFVVGCGGDDGGGSGADAGSAGFTLTNSDNSGHTHTLTVLCIDLAGEAPVTYTTGVGDAHTHTVMLTADEVMRIAAGETVDITFTDGHEHTFLIAVPDGECA